jgi:hypothetical protein
MSYMLCRCCRSCVADGRSHGHILNHEHHTGLELLINNPREVSVDLVEYSAVVFFGAGVILPDNKGLDMWHFLGTMQHEHSNEDKHIN